METAQHRPEPSRSSLVILPRRAGGDDVAVNGIADATGLSAYDVRQRCLSGKPAVLLRSPDTFDLESARGRLKTLGHGAVVFSEDEVREEPYPLSVRSVAISGPALAFLNHEGRAIAELSSSQEMLLLITNPALHGETPFTLGLSRRAASAQELHEEAERRLARLLAPPLDQVLLDFVWDGSPRLRIRAGRFNFHSLGERASGAIAPNMKTLLALLAGRARRPVLDVAGAAIQAPHTRLFSHQMVDTHEYDRQDDDIERTYEIYCRTLVVLWRKGLFSGITSERLPAGCATYLTRASGEPYGDSPAGRTSGEPYGDSPAGQASGEPYGYSPAGRTSGEPHGGSPVVQPSGAPHPEAITLPRSTPVPHRGVLDTIRRWGPPVLILPLLATTLGGLLLARSRPLAPVIAALAAGSLALTHAFTLFIRRRRIENVPTSRIRSAAAGYCEIAGTAETLVPLLTPFSRMPCVYFEYRMTPVRRGAAEATGSEDLFSGGQRLGLVRDGTQTGNSGSLPFQVRDETGTVEVDPRGAVVEVSREQVLYNPPFKGGLFPPETPVVVREKYIPVGYPLYVLGELRPAGTVRAGAAEKSAHRAGGTTGLVLTRPAGSDIFYISDRSEKKIVRSMALRAQAALSLGAALVVLAVLLLGRVLGGSR